MGKRPIAKGMLGIKGNILQIALVLIILAVGVGVRFYHISYPHIATQDTGFFSGFAKNLDTYGFVEQRFLPTFWFFADTGDRLYHISHPPLVHNTLGLLYRIFGYHGAVYHVYNIVTGGLLGAIFLYLLLAYKLNRNVAIWGLVVWAIIPSGAYFERIHFMDSQACVMITAMLYFFFKFSEKPRPMYGIPLALSCVIGVLSNWNFLFVLPFLILYSLIIRKCVRLSLIITLFSILIGLGYMIISSMIQGNSGVPIDPGISPELGVMRHWIDYIVDHAYGNTLFSVYFYWRMFRQFVIHFTAVSLIIPFLWIWAVRKESFSGKNISLKIVLPLLLASPLIVFFIFGPGTAVGHLWTLHLLLPAMATLFGIVMYYLISRRNLWDRLLIVFVMGGLLFFSVPAIYRLHGLSKYHTVSVRAGRLISQFSEQARFAVAGNEDTLSAYTDIPVLCFAGRERITKDFLEGEKTKLPCYPGLSLRQKPSFIVLNRVWVPVTDADSEAMDKEFSQYGYYHWLRDPVNIWTNVQTENLFLFMDQYSSTSEGDNEVSNQPSPCYLVSGDNLLRGFYHELTQSKRRETVFRGIDISEGLRELHFSVLVQGSSSKHIPQVHYAVLLYEGNTYHLMVEGDLESSLSLKHLSVDISKFSGRRIDVIFRSETEGDNNGSFLYWSEPRMVGEKFIPKKTFLVGPEPDIYRDNPFSNVLSPYFRLLEDGIKKFVK